VASQGLDTTAQDRAKLEKTPVSAKLSVLSTLSSGDKMEDLVVEWRHMDWTQLDMTGQDWKR